MMNFLRKHMRKIFIVTVIAFLAGTFMGGGAYLFGPAKDFDAAVKVNGSKITMKLFSSLYNSSLNMYRNTAKEELSPQQLEELKFRTVQALVQDELFYQQSLKYKILVSDTELRNDIQNSALFRNAKKDFDPNIYYAFLNSIKMSPKDYENFRRKQISGEKLKLLLASAVKVSDSEFKEASSAAGADINRDTLLRTKGNALLNEWFAEVLSRSNIVTNDKFLRQI